MLEQKNELKHHLQKVHNAQHERLIHLMVTLTVALITILLFALFILTSNPLIGGAVLICLCLLTAYLIHYRKLENQVQSQYATTDKLFSALKDTYETP
jgi:Ca2+/Na+ antiporter